ncbi:hypothetical protein HYE68_008826 [Fusarium pseudograminearum]|nr:hypothetical protein HYE68_008826 [Fusarium pseudograminearum]
MEQIQVAMYANNEALNVAAMLNQPSPPLGSKNVKAIVEGWKGEQKAQLGQLAIRGYFKLSTYHVIDDRIKRYDTPRVYELHETFPDGTKAWKGKVGIPKTRADIQTHNLAKTALLRNAANAAILNMAATALFDIKTLFNGEFQKYFVKLGISGMYGGAAAGIQARIHHPVFGNGAVVGVVVSSAFGVVGLVNTGDWARFVKNTGLGIVGSAGAWGGSQLGAMENLSDWQLGDPKAFEAFIDGLRKATSS